MSGGLENRLLREQIRGVKLDNASKASGLSSPDEFLARVMKLQSMNQSQQTHQRAMQREDMTQERLPQSLDQSLEQQRVSTEGIGLDNTRKSFDNSVAEDDRLVNQEQKGTELQIKKDTSELARIQQLLSASDLIGRTHDTSPIAEKLAFDLGIEPQSMRKLPNPYLDSQGGQQNEAQVEANSGLQRRLRELYGINVNNEE